MEYLCQSPQEKSLSIFLFLNLLGTFYNVDDRVEKVWYEVELNMK